MSTADESLLKAIRHYQESLDKYTSSSSKHTSHSKRKRNSDASDSEEESKPEKRLKKNKCSKDDVNTSSKSKSDPIHGIDSGSGASFAEALGMCDPSSSKSSPKKKYSVPEKLTKEKIATRSQNPIPKLPKDLAVDALDINLSNALWPAISTNYRLFCLLKNSLMSDGAPKKVLSDYEQFSNIISSKNQRTKVYSGNKTAGGSVPSLFEKCLRILQDNIDALEYTGGVSYATLKPVLDKANPNQLSMLEHNNPYLIEDTDELWQIHCQKEFRNKKRQELETWREMYRRCLDEREAKLKALTANIKQSQDKSLPVRTTKLAYVDNIAKPSRNIAKKQAKNGTSCEKNPAKTPSARLSSLATAGEAGKVLVPNPGVRAAGRLSHHATVKSKKAPLMAKTLLLLKNRNRFFKR